MKQLVKMFLSFAFALPMIVGLSGCKGDEDEDVSSGSVANLELLFSRGWQLSKIQFGETDGSGNSFKVLEEYNDDSRTFYIEKVKEDNNYVYANSEIWDGTYAIDKKNAHLYEIENGKVDTEEIFDDEEFGKYKYYMQITSLSSSELVLSEYELHPSVNAGECERFYYRTVTK